MVEISVASAVGEGPAIESMAFLKLTEKYNIKDILRDPKRIRYLSGIDVIYSAVSSIADYYRRNKELLSRVIEICEYLEPEFSILLLRLVKDVDEDYFKKAVVDIPAWHSLSREYA